MHRFRTPCPIATRTDESFVQHTILAGSPHAFEFQKPVLWLAKAESTLRFIHGGHEVHVGPSFSDVYGYLSSLDITRPTPEELAQGYAITRESSLELVVSARIFLEPAIETDEDKRENAARPPNHMPIYRYIPDEWRQRRADSDGEPRYARLEACALATATVWSSKLSTTENANLREAFCARWREGPWVEDAAPCVTEATPATS